MSTTASDGTEYMLEVPAGALMTPQEITITPIRSIRELGLSGGLAGAVQLEPSGLTFARPALLRIRTPRSGPAGTRLVGFTAGIDFAERELSPALAKGGEVLVFVSHFSQSGAGFGTIEDVRQFSTALPSSLQDIVFQVLGLLPGPWNAATQAQADSLALRAFQQILLPALQSADSDAKLLQAIAVYSYWRLLLSIVAFADVSEVFGVDNFELTIPANFQAASQQARTAATPRLREAIDGNIRVCGDEGSRQAHRNVYSWMEQAGRLGISSAEVTGDAAAFIAKINSECVTPVLLENNLPSTLTLGTPISLDLRFAAEYRNGKRDTADFAVRLAGSGVTIANPEGFTGIGDADNPLGFYTTVITPTSSIMTLTAQVRLFDSDRVPPQPDPDAEFTLSEAEFDLAGSSCVVLAILGTRRSARRALAPAGRLTDRANESCEEPPPPPPPPPPPGLDVGEIFVGTHRFQGTSDEFPSALFFNKAKTRATICQGGAHIPDGVTAFCGTLVPPPTAFAANTAYRIYAITFSGDEFAGHRIGGSENVGEDSRITLQGVIRGDTLTTRVDDRRSVTTPLFNLYSMKRR